MIMIFKLNKHPHLKIGYNSLGADCINNNLHCHIVRGDKLFSATKKMPIEEVTKKWFYQSSLKHLDEDDIDMYSCQARLGYLDLGEGRCNWPLHTLVVQAIYNPTGQKDDTYQEAIEALAHAVGFVLSYMNESGNETPHNLLIADE